MRPHSLVAVSLLLSASLAAHADELFTLTTGSDSFQFTLPSNPTPGFVDPNQFVLFNVPVDFDGTTSNSVDIRFTNAGSALFISGNTYTVEVDGPTLFGNTTSNPVFMPLGPLSLSGFLDTTGTADSADFTLTITSTVTPEPSTIALLGPGLLGVAGVVRRRLA